MSDLQASYEPDGRVRITCDQKIGDEQLISEQLIERADARFLTTDGDTITCRGHNGTWTYQIDAHETSPLGAHWVRTHLIAISDVGTDERVQVLEAAETWRRSVPTDA